VNFDPIVVAMMTAIQMLDHATPDEVDPDFAVCVQQMMGDYLDELSRDDVAEFRGVLTRIAEERSADDPVIAGYLRRLSDGMASQQ
jgi:hypothetical protein